MQTVIRHTFTPEEVAAAMIQNVPKAQEIQVRFTDGYVEIDIVGPAAAGEPEKAAPESAAHATKASEPDNAPAPADDTAKAEEPKLGKNAKLVLEHCALGGFQVFLDVETEKDALERVLFTCNAAGIESFDNNKTAMAAFKDICADFQIWCGGAD